MLNARPRAARRVHAGATHQPTVGGGGGESLLTFDNKTPVIGNPIRQKTTGVVQALLLRGCSFESGLQDHARGLVLSFHWGR